MNLEIQYQLNLKKLIKIIFVKQPLVRDSIIYLIKNHQTLLKLIWKPIIQKQIIKSKVLPITIIHILLKKISKSLTTNTNVFRNNNQYIPKINTLIQIKKYIDINNNRRIISKPGKVKLFLDFALESPQEQVNSVKFTQQSK